MSKKSTGSTRTNYRDAKTGHYIPKAEALRRPATTVKETDRLRKRK